jgi:hydrogenase 3 maturation protease
MLARRLADHSRLRAMDCGDRPEDFTADIARERPDTIVLADAVDMGAPPGSVAWLEEADVPDRPADTHRASLRMLMQYLRLRTGADVVLLGIQPAVVSEGLELSPPVAGSVERLVSLFTTRGQPGEVAVEATRGSSRERSCTSR